MTRSDMPIISSWDDLEAGWRALRPTLKSAAPEDAKKSLHAFVAVHFGEPGR